jgi:hypothetical protein
MLKHSHPFKPKQRIKNWIKSWIKSKIKISLKRRTWRRSLRDSRRRMQAHKSNQLHPPLLLNSLPIAHQYLTSQIIQLFTTVKWLRRGWMATKTCWRPHNRTALRKLLSLGYSSKQLLSKRERLMVGPLPHKSQKWRYPENQRRLLFILRLSQKRR